MHTLYFSMTDELASSKRHSFSSSSSAFSILFTLETHCFWWSNELSQFVVVASILAQSQCRFDSYRFISIRLELIWFVSFRLSTKNMGPIWRIKVDWVCLNGHWDYYYYGSMSFLVSDSSELLRAKLASGSACVLAAHSKQYIVCQQIRPPLR